jgi:hypothetical protein
MLSSGGKGYNLVPCTFTDPDNENGVPDNTPKQLADANKDEKPAARREKPVQSPADAQTEYMAIAQFHIAIYNSRFTIASLYVAAVGFIVSAMLSATSTWGARAGGSVLAFWLTACLYVLELRNRYLYRNIDHRGMDIEHSNWNLSADTGLFSRLNLGAGTGLFNHLNNEALVGADRTKISLMKAPLPDYLSRTISHTLGLDLLYGGSIVFWFFALIVSLYYFAKSICLI